MRGALSLTLALGALAASAAGCTQEAVLELQLMLPARSEESPARVALIQVGRAEAHPFDAEWAREALRVELADEPTLAQWSVVSVDPTIDLHVRVRFCDADDCAPRADGELWFALERPFYLERRTSWASCVEAAPRTIPTAPEVVGRCEIHGCLVGSAPERWCRHADEHYCETLSTDRTPRDLSCYDGRALY